MAKSRIKMKKSVVPLLILIYALFPPGCGNPGKIDRYSLIARHNIINNSFDSLSSLSVGNGDFAFTVDMTGLQTFPEPYSKGISLGTMSNRGWHTGLNPLNYSLDDVYKKYKLHGRDIEYVTQFRAGEDERKVAASDWLRSNPHRIHMGMVGLSLIRDDGTEAGITDLENAVQKLDLWSGEIDSRFTFSGKPVHVITVCHPEADLVSVRISSKLLSESRLRIKIRFPFGVSSPNGYDFNNPAGHITQIIQDSGGVTVFGRQQDSDRYNMALLRNNAKLTKAGEHYYLIEPGPQDSVYAFSFQFFKPGSAPTPFDFENTIKASRAAWQKFWTEGAAVDFSECTDPRAFELERRVILSQYLTKIQCSGFLPPAETGLTYNSWFGKFHLEMHWWHAVHFALWGRQEILEKQMQYYSDILERARLTAGRQGYRGARWPKMTSPDGRESPSTVGTYLIWQQPHPVFFAELLYNIASDKEAVLEKYREIVFATADFMASYAWYDTSGKRYTLGPVLIPAQESLKLETTINPVFELAYWKWGLKTACDWRIRLHLPPDSLWTSVAENISRLPVLDSLYLCSEDTRDSWINPKYMSDHPIVAAVSGFVPDVGLVDKAIMRNTLDTIMKKWNWKSTWGWDFPMLSMSASRAGRPAQALDFLLMDAPKNRYLVNGHNYQDQRLSVYLPGNGGLLTAVAYMCTTNGFPKDGKWKVKWEKLNRYPE